MARRGHRRLLSSLLMPLVLLMLLLLMLLLILRAGCQRACARIDRMGAISRSSVEWAGVGSIIQRLGPTMLGLLLRRWRWRIRKSMILRWRLLARLPRGWRLIRLASSTVAGRAVMLLGVGLLWRRCPCWAVATMPLAGWHVVVRRSAGQEEGRFAVTMLTGVGRARRW